MSRASNSGCCYSLSRRDMGGATSVRGLMNCGLSCCINALLQSFAATPELVEILNRWQPRDEADGRNVPLQLRRAFEAMKDKQQPSPHLDFLKCLHHYNIHRHTEHDADEVFHAILNLIQEQMANPDLAAQVKALYKVTVDGCNKCLTCKNVHRIPTYFVSLPLHLKDNKDTLEDCFQSFFASNELDEGEELYCDSCEKKTPSSQGFELVSLPSILCLHLKRFRNINGYTYKLFCKVTFTETISIDAIIQGGNSEDKPRGSYRLFAVIVHFGTSMLGHYTAYICSEDQWYYVDDSRVCKVSWRRVQEAYGGERFSETAYMLLYRKCRSEPAQETPV